MPLPKKDTTAADIYYDAEGFAASRFTFCRTYRSAGALTEKLGEALDRQVQAGAIAVLEPEIYGGAVRIRPCSPLKKKRDLLRSGGAQAKLPASFFPSCIS